MDVLRLQNPYIRWQQAIDRFAKIFAGNRIVQIECRDLGERVNSRIGASRSADMNRLAFEASDNFFKRPLDRRASRLNLPSGVIGAIVGNGDAYAPRVSHVAVGREPGFTTGKPCWHSGQVSGGNAFTSNTASATRGTPRSALPPLRSMIEPAPVTTAPSLVRISTTSFELPPVVMTSSITTACSPGLPMHKPSAAASSFLRPSRSVKMKRQPSARATS